MDWLSPLDLSKTQHDVLNWRHGDTGRWFLESPEFNSWLHGPSQTLFCPGMPGAGKTMLAAIAIDHISRTLNEDVRLAYLFCNYKTQSDQRAIDFFSVLLKQFAQNRTDVPASIRQMYEDCSNRKRRPSFHEINQALELICLGNTGYIVVDALDECTRDNDTRGQLIRGLRQLQKKTNVKLLCTSRFISEVIEQFKDDPRLVMQASKDDVREFVVGQMSRLPRCVQRDEDLRRTVQHKIVDAVDSM